MKKITTIILFLTILFPLLISSALAQEKNFPIRDIIKTIVGDGSNTGDSKPEPPGGGELQPGLFKPPFKCGLTYTGSTYPTHTNWAIDFNSQRGDDRGEPVFPSANGSVAYVKKSDGAVIIRHAGGYATTYGHMRNITVRVGNSVRLGQKIGEISDVGGGTGPHLHTHHCRTVALCFTLPKATTIPIKYNGKKHPASLVGKYIPTSPGVGKVSGPCL